MISVAVCTRRGDKPSTKMWQQIEINFTNELALFEILSPDKMYLNAHKRRLSVFEALSSENNSEKSISRTSSNCSLSSYSEFQSKIFGGTQAKKFVSTDDEKDFEIGLPSDEIKEKSNIFSLDDFKEGLSAAENSVSKRRRRNTKNVKENGTSKKKKFRKVEEIAKQLFFDHSTKYSLVLTKKMENSLLKNDEFN